MHYSYYIMPLATMLRLSSVNADSTTASETCIDASSPLVRARNLKAPQAIDTQDAEYENASFWDEHGPLLQDAWKEFEESVTNGFIPPSSFIEPALDTAIQDVFDNPTDETEAVVKEYWRRKDGGQVLPKGVFSAQVLSQSGIVAIRELLDAATSSGIPTRRPNGMNRHGVIIDHDVHGAVPMKSLLRLVEDELINRIVRPVGRMLFPDRVGCEDDIEYFAFAIKYDGSFEDESDGDDTTSNDETEQDGNEFKRDILLKEHRDASVVTLNINLNLPDEGYGGSQVYFREYPTGESEDATTTYVQGDDHDSNLTDGGSVRFTPGMALIHLGAHRHGSLPISASSTKIGGGKRYNLIVWLFGKDGDVRIAPYDEADQMNVMERWHGCNHTEAFKFE